MKRTFSDTLMEYDSLATFNTNKPQTEPTEYWKQMATQIEMHNKQAYHHLTQEEGDVLADAS